MSTKTILFTFFRLNDNYDVNYLRQKFNSNFVIKYEKDRYFSFLKEDILNLNDALTLDLKIDNRYYIGPQKNIEIKNFSVKLILFPDKSTGLFLFTFDWRPNQIDPLSELPQLVEFRNFGIDQHFIRNEFLLFCNEIDSKFCSWKDVLFEKFSALPNFITNCNFYSNKIGRIHLIDNRAIDLNEEDFITNAYNSIRIVGKNIAHSSNSQISSNAYTDPRIHSFAINEGIILTEKGLTANEIHSKYAPILYHSVIIKSGFTDISYQLLALDSDLRINPRLGIHSSNKIEGLRKLRKFFLLLKFTSKLPISNYNEIERLREFYLNKFSSEVDFEKFSDSLEDLFEFLQDERDREDSSRDEKISLILALMGLTGFISFIFDYIFVNGDIRLIDYLKGPTTWFPILSFTIIAILFFPFIRKR
jgi:hypothetical protein